MSFLTPPYSLSVVIRGLLTRRTTREMAGIERRKTWTELLLSLFNLLVDNADGVIDDTSLERILEWLKCVCQNEHQLQNLMQCGTVEFMSKDHVFTNPESTAFFLRLLGFLVSRTEIFHSLKCSKDGDIVSRLLMRPRDEPHLWNEGIVRNGYFQALISLTEHTDGMFWLKDSGENMIIIDRKEASHPNSEFAPGGVIPSDS